MAQAILRRDTLHPLLRISVYRQFATGSYDTAVRDAFLIVEEWLTIGWPEEKLAKIVTQDSMIGASRLQEVTG